MSSRQYRRHFAARIGLVAALLAMVQAAAGWPAQASDGRYAQRGEAALIQIVESQWGRTSEASKPDRNSDPPAIVPADVSPATHRFRDGIIPGSPAVADRARAVVLPGIRAPPLTGTSA